MINYTVQIYLPNNYFTATLSREELDNLVDWYNGKGFTNYTVKYSDMLGSSRLYLKRQHVNAIYARENMEIKGK